MSTTRDKPPKQKAPTQKAPSKPSKKRKDAVPRVEMRRRREQLGYTQEQAAAAIGVSLSSWKGWEDGTRNPLPGHRPAIARLLIVPTTEAQSWFDKTKRRPAVIALSGWLGHFASLEQGASYIWTFETVAVPGLLQTAAYAGASTAVGPGSITEAEVSRNIEVRLARQIVLKSESDPLALTAVIDESVLTREAGGPDIMAEQLDDLIRVAEMPNIELRILHRKSHYFPFGSFTLLGVPESPEPVMACVESYRGMSYFERDQGVDDYIELYKFIRDLALSPNASVELIERVAKEMT